MILDGTLTQFADYLQSPIPPLLWLPWATARPRYHYHADGPYTYSAWDIRPDLVDRVLAPDFGPQLPLSRM
jgi:hypothetical protein